MDGVEGGIPRCYLWKGLKCSRLQRLQFGARWLSWAMSGGSRDIPVLPNATEAPALYQGAA